MSKYVHQLSPWERSAMQQLYKYPGSSLGPSRSNTNIGGQGLVRQGLATATGIPSTFRWTVEGRAEHQRRWPQQMHGLRSILSTTGTLHSLSVPDEDDAA